jgi:hypothetical protein
MAVVAARFAIVMAAICIAAAAAWESGDCQRAEEGTDKSKRLDQRFPRY